MIYGLIVLSLLVFSLETVPGLSASIAVWLDRFEVFTVAVFTLEYFVRLYVSRPRRRYLLSFLGMVDLLAILPFYLGGAIDLRSLRAFRLLRLVRILKLARYSAAVQRLSVALRIAKEELLLFLAVALIVLYLAAAGIYTFESEAQPEHFGSVFQSLWWAVVTLTTVGYGDVYPITVGGRIFTFFVLLLGVGLIAVPSGMIASPISKARQLEEELREEGKSEGESG
jgi:voltage-gated potassium channel